MLEPAVAVKLAGKDLGPGDRAVTPAGSHIAVVGIDDEGWIRVVYDDGSRGEWAPEALTPYAADRHGTWRGRDVA